MTRTVVLAGCPSAVAVTESLLAAGIPISEIVTAGPDAADTVRHAPMTSTISHRRCPGAMHPDADPLPIRADLVVSVFTPVPPLAEPMDTAPVVHVGTTRSPTVPTDPVAEAILSGAQTLPVVTQLAAQGRTIRSQRADLATTGTSLDVAKKIAEVVGQILEGDELTTGPGLSVAHESASPPDFATPSTHVVPWPEAWDEVDWSRPADIVHRTIRAATLPGRGAWTWFDGTRLGLHRCTKIETTVFGAPTGTVLGHTGDGLIVQTGSGSVCVEGFRDVLGPFEASTIPNGIRLGRDSSNELAALTRRLQDLERLVLTMVGNADLLRTRDTPYLPRTFDQ